MHKAFRLAALVAAFALWWPSAVAIAADDPAQPTDESAEPSEESDNASAAEGDDHGHANGHEHADEDGHAHSDADGHSHSDEEGHGHDDGHGHGTAHGHEEHDVHHAGPASNHPLSIDPDLAIVTAIVFVVLLIVLQKFAWGPILAGLAIRENGIAEDIAIAGAKRKDAEKMLSEYQDRLERAGEEVRAMLDGAKKEAEAMKATILSEAAKAAADQKDDATREIDAAKDKALSEIAGDSVNIAFRVASSALRREVNPDDHRDLVSESGL